MTATLYTSRYVLPITVPPFEDGALLVVNGKIKAIGVRRELEKTNPGTEIIDFGDAALLPPMVNAHTHLELTHFPEWSAASDASGKPRGFVDWILQLVSVRRQVSTGQMHDSLVAGLNASLNAGTGAVGDIFTTLEIADVYQRSPLAGRVFVEVLGHDASVVDARLNTIAERLPNEPGPNLGWGLSPHSPYTLSAAVLDHVFSFADGNNLQSSIHLAESCEESVFLKEGSGAIADSLYAAARWNPQADPPPGCSPVQALCRPGRLRSRDLVIHGVQVDKDDVAILKKSGCTVVLCPRSNAELDVGKAPVADYLKADIPLAIGTDSLASAPSLSIWEEMAFAQDWFSNAASPAEWLEIATMGGSKALALNRRMGALSSGFDASFQIVTLPALPALQEIEDALCHAGETIKISGLYLSGQNALP